MENAETAPLTIVGYGPDNTIAVLKKSKDCAFHMHIDPLMYPMVLERTDHLQACSVTNMREPRVFMSAEIAL